LEELDAAALETLHSSAHKLLAQVELAQERLEVSEEVAQKFPDFRCPISMHLMHDPVMGDDGNTYERKYITAWFAEKATKFEPITSPLTRDPMSSKLVSNRALKNLINSAVEAKLAKLGKRKREN